MAQFQLNFLFDLAIVLILVMLSMGITSSQEITAQLYNSTITEESVNPPIDIINTISVLLFVIALISISMTFRKRKKHKIRNVIALVILFVSIGAFVSSLPNPNTNDGFDDGYRALAIFLVISALIIAFIPRVHRTEKTIPWKKRKGIRRQFSAQVRD
jgi:uncharacterized membrane protein YfcA